jgi:hypothetical protein
MKKMKVNRNWILLGTATCIIIALNSTSGCSHQGGFSRTSDAALKNDEAFKSAAAQAARDMGLANRKPAATSPKARAILNNLEMNFSNLNGAKFYTVFPKKSNISEKNQNLPSVSLAPPQLYKINVMWSDSCAKITKSQNLPNFVHAEYFSSATQGLCKVLRVVRTAPKKTNWLEGDVKELRLHLGTGYRAFGIDTDLHANKRDTKTSPLKWDASKSLSSGLSNFPIDFPNVSEPRFTELLDLGYDRMPELPNYILALFEGENLSKRMQTIRKNLKFDSKGRLCAKGIRLDYIDFYGSNTQVSWCQQDLLPTTIENDRFFAILNH